MTVQESDHARVVISSPLQVQVMHDLLQDTELLFRINPFLHIQSWQGEQDEIRIQAVNLQNKRQLQQTVRIEPANDHLTLHYTDGIKAFTRFDLQAKGRGSELSITDDYSRFNEAERQQRLHEVDQTLVPWAHALNRYFRRYKRWSWIPAYKIVNRFWFSMSPGQRLVSRIVIWASAIEFVIFLLLWGQYH